MELPPENPEINRLQGEIQSDIEQLKEKEDILNKLRLDHFNRIYKSMGFNSHLELIHTLNDYLGLGLKMPKRMQKKTFEKYKKASQEESSTPEKLAKENGICLVEARMISNSENFVQYTQRYIKNYEPSKK
jgi:hypothetical protein